MTERINYSFIQAIIALRDGRRVTKAEWDNPAIYCLLRDGILQIHNAEGWHSWIVSAADLEGDDWQILD